MMQCDKIQSELLAYLAGELPLEERAEIQRHLSECPACTEEATIMKETGYGLHAGLGDWVDKGICPPELMSQLEESIRSISLESSPRKRAWYQSWPAMVGAVAAAAVLVVVLGGQLGVRDELAAIPFLGTVATRLFPGAMSNFTQGLIPLRLGDSHDGITLTLSELEASKNQVRIHYALAGSDLNLDADSSAYVPTLRGLNTQIKLQSISVSRNAEGLAIDAFFDAIPAGEPLLFTIDQLPVKSTAGAAKRSGPWKAAFNG